MGRNLIFSFPGQADYAIIPRNQDITLPMMTKFLVSPGVDHSVNMHNPRYEDWKSLDARYARHMVKEDESYLRDNGPCTYKYLHSLS
jgi:hypothetical protein